MTYTPYEPPVNGLSMARGAIFASSSAFAFVGSFSAVFMFTTPPAKGTKTTF